MNKIMINNLTLISAVLVAVFLASCGGESEDATDPFAFDPLPDQYKPGAINVGSIVNAPSVRNAVLLAVKQVNDTGGVLGREYNVVSFVADGTENAVIQAEKLLEVDIKVINVSYSSRSKAVSELSIPKQVPLISESATSPFFTAYDDNDFYFRLVPSDVIQSRILAEIAIEQGHSTAVSVHNDTDQYGITLVEHFVSNFELLGGSVLEQVAVPLSVSTGFDQYLQVISDHNPDMVLNSLIEAGESANFVNEAKSKGIQSKFLFPDASAGVSAFANNIANVETVTEVLGTAPGFGLSTNPEMIYFSESYQQQFGVMPDGFNVSGYDFAMVAALAIEHAGYVNGTDNPTGLMVRNSLRTVMNPPGLVVGPSNIGDALQAIRSGQDVDYSGSYGANDWDNHGDVTGEITYDVMSIDSESKSWQTVFQQQLFVPLDSTN